MAKKTTKKQVAEVAQKAGNAAAKSAKKVGKAVSENPKTALYVVGGVLVVFAGYKLFQAVNNAFKGNDVDNSVANTGGSTNGATISNQQAINYAQQLLDAMNAKEPFYGTDEEVIEAVFNQLKNGQDFIKVFNAFGKKDYNGHNSPAEGGIWNWIDSYEKRDLIYWLRSEISANSDAALYNLVKTRVESTGVFTF